MGRQTKTSMEITCKDIRDNKRLTVSLDTEDKVQDLINKISLELGEENSYSLVCCGKRMSELDQISRYSTSSLLPIIVMVTTPEQSFRYNQQIRLVEQSLSTPVYRGNQSLCYDSGFDSE